MSLSMAQISWLSELDRYMKYNVSIYEVESDSYDLGKVDFSIVFKKDNKDDSDSFDFSLTLREGEEKTENVYKLSSPSTFRIPCKEIKEKFIEFLENNDKNIRVVIQDFSKIYLLSTYNEKYEEKKYMYDDLICVMNYMIRFPTLDNDGYYILSGMSGHFEKETFRQKYNIEMSETFPYS
jgi:hypothetical protein